MKNIKDLIKRFDSLKNADSPFVTIDLNHLAKKINKTKGEAFEILFEAERAIFFGRSDRFPDAIKGTHPFKILGVHGLEGKSEKTEVAEIYISPVTFKAIEAFDLIENLPSLGSF